MPAAHHTEVFNCTVPEFFKIVSDYERYPEFLTEVKDCRVVKNENGRKLVEYKVSMIKSFSYSLWMKEQEPSLITWDFASGDIFKSMSGSWKLDSEADKCRVTYDVDASFGIFVPGPIAKTLLTVNLPTMMGAYHKRVKEVYGK